MKQENGFSLIETVIAMGILASGLLGMAALFTLGVTHMATSSANLVAREKAREAVESVHTARDTRSIVWCQIWNYQLTPRAVGCDTANDGVFLQGFQPMYKPGPDGLVGTADDDDAGTAGIEELVAPGPDGALGTADDIKTPLNGFKRRISITTLNGPSGSVTPNLRQIQVTIEYSVGSIKRTYTLTTYISSIS
jgi:type II secretory pathway pseudopilin PulG